jgi:uncharacterized protein (TIGR02453 family)
MASIYFTKATFRFLRDLKANNNRPWFQENKPRYEEVLRQPFLQLIADLQAPLAKISAHFVADSRSQGGPMFRIYRDTRFAHDKTPYKTWSGARLYHERAREVDAPSFYLHFQQGDCFVGGGKWHPQPESVKRIREFIVNNPAAWEKATRSKSFTSHFTLGGDSLVRPPRGFDPEHALIEDIKRKDFVASERFADGIAISSELKPLLVDRFKRIAPMVDYLCASLELDF